MWVLLVEDEPRIRAFVTRGLGAEGLTVEERDDGHFGLRRALAEGKAEAALQVDVL